MKAKRDPEKHELAHLVNACPLRGQQILEIGCGDGRFTFQYSDSASRVIGIDLDKDDLNNANTGQPGQNVDFIQGTVEYIPFSSEIFDVVIFASSL